MPSPAGKYALFFFCDLIRNDGVERVVPVSSERRRGMSAFKVKSSTARRTEIQRTTKEGQVRIC
jgi:hypothetical protein